MINIQKDFASAIIKTKEEFLKSSFSCYIEKITIKDFYLLDEIKVDDRNNFGKGYGKKLFKDILSKYKQLVIFPSFVSYEDDTAFSFREAISIENIEEAPLKLLNEFYIPILIEMNIKYLIKDTEEGKMIIIDN